MSTALKPLEVPNRNLYSSFQEQLDWNKSNSWPDLPAQMRVFAHSYIEDFDHSRAAKDAGLINKGPALLRNPLLSAYLDWLTLELATDSIIRREWVEIQMLEHLSVCKGEKEVYIADRDGSSVLGKKYHANEVGQILKELAKISRAYPDTMGGGGGAVQVNINLAGFGLKQVDAIIDDMTDSNIIDITPSVDE